MLLRWSTVAQSYTVLVLQSFPPHATVGVNFIPSASALCLHPPPPPPSVFLYRKTASNRDCLSSLSVTLKQQGVNGPSVPPPSDPSHPPAPPLAKDTAKATAIVFKLFILSQDCVVIYIVNTENTL